MADSPRKTRPPRLTGGRVFKREGHEMRSSRGVEIPIASMDWSIDLVEQALETARVRLLRLG
jgi:hypothetical protein